jgi:PDZ domain-containing secreted protein
LVSGDVVLRVNGQPVTDGASWREALGAPQIGDVVRVDYARDGERRSAEVTLTGYDVATVRLEELPRVSERMRRMRKLWMAGAQ